MKILTPNAKYAFDIDDKLLEQVDLRDSAQVVKETWVENVYQIQVGDFFDTGIFIDLGANIGAVSLYVASFNDNRDSNPIRVIAYEPEPTNLKYLSKNIKANHKIEQIKIVNKAVYDFEGTMKITNRGGNSTLNTGEGEDVEVIPLRDVFKNNKISECDVMKIDIESAEYAVLLGADVETLQRIKYLTLEFTGTSLEQFGKLTAHLAQVYNLHIIGTPQKGGYIYGRRY